MSLPGTALSLPTVPVGLAAPTTLAASESLTEWYGLTRWLAFAGYTLLVGTMYFVATCWPQGAKQIWVRRMMWGGWTTLLAATVAALVVYGPYARGVSAGELLDPSLLASTLRTRVGVTLMMRIGLLGLAALGLLGLLRASSTQANWQHTRRVRGGSVLAGAAVLAMTWSLSSHSAVGSSVVVALLADTVHLVAAGAWIGGLVVLAVVLLQSRNTKAMRIAVPRFSRRAAACVGLLLVTGLYQSWRQVGTQAALLTTSYGRLLTVKVGLVAVLVLLGAASRSRVHRHFLRKARAVGADTRRGNRTYQPASPAGASLRWLVLAEVGLASAVLILAALLVDMRPARAEYQSAATHLHAAAPAPPAALSSPMMDPGAQAPTKAYPYDTGGGPNSRGLMAVSLMPGMAHIQVLSNDRKPLEIPGVQADLSLPERSVGPQPLNLTHLGPGMYLADNMQPSIPGRWQLRILVRTSDVNQTTVTVPLNAY